MASRALVAGSSILAGIASLAAASSSWADVVIGSWESNSAEGWIDWQTQAPLDAPKYTYDAFGATNGNRAVKVTQNGFGQALSIKLQDTAGFKNAFFANQKFSIDYSVIGNGDSGWNEVYALWINAQGYGFTAQETTRPKLQYGFPNVNRTTTLTWDYSALVDGDAANGEIAPSAGWVELIIGLNSDGLHNEFWFDNARLSTTAKPGDFNQDTLLNAADVELLLHQPNGPVSGNAIYDVNADNQIVTAPRAANSDTDYWVTTLAGTRYGDTNFDKKVDFSDLVTLAQHYNQAGTWSEGSFDGDGTVAFGDLVLMAQNYGFLGSASLAELGEINGDFAADWLLAQALVPEPTTLAALALIVPAVRRRRA